MLIQITEKVVRLEDDVTWVKKHEEVIQSKKQNVKNLLQTKIPIPQVGRIKIVQGHGERTRTY